MKAPNSSMPIAERGGLVTQPWFIFFQALAASVVSGVAGVASFMGRTGAVLLTGADVETALGYTPGDGTVTTTGSPYTGAPAVFTGPTSIGPGSGSGASGTLQVAAAVNLTAGDFVSLSATGAILADATDGTKPADGFVVASYNAGSLATVYLPGQNNTALSGLTEGTLYFLGLAGAATATVPTSGAAQVLGKATSTTSIAFASGPNLAPTANLNVVANIAGSVEPPIGVGLSAVIDAAIGGAQGDILYRDASSWKALAPGTAGQVLQTGGASANPSWATGGGGGGGLFSYAPITKPTLASTGLNANVVGSGTVDSIAGISVSPNANNWTSSVPATPYSITIICAGAVNANAVGIGWTDGTKAQFIYIDSTGKINVQSDSSILTNPAVFYGTNYSAVWPNLFGNIYWIKIRDDGTSVYFMASNDGIQWGTAYSVAKSAGYLGSSGYSHIFIGAGPAGAILSWAQGT